MNIKQAKEQIKNAMIAYFTKDEYGEYVLPTHQQRPVFLMGAPGIGKTAIMAQIASEMGVGLLSYSMTHHTRQSALGLPFIVNKTYAGTEYQVSEYTMSEIISSVYDMMENSGVKEGILFLDEINCVSETLAPIMLQFLQYKVFGRHTVPKGWIVVTAGNPPEYNNSVREFDVVTWDRLKRVDIEPDFEAWKEYAIGAHIHPAVLTYLENKPADFYKVETNVDGKRFITARGWEDLSRMIRLYEQNGIKVDLNLICQYLQNQKIARDFAQYYDLFNKYRSDYQVDSIMAGTYSQEIVNRAHKARFDERLALIGMIMDHVNTATQDHMDDYQMVMKLHDRLAEMRNLLRASKDPASALGDECEKARVRTESLKKASAIKEEEVRVVRKLIAALENGRKLINGMAGEPAYSKLADDYRARTAALKRAGAELNRQIGNVIDFIEKVFGDGQEMVVLITEMTVAPYTAAFLSRYQCTAYYRHNRSMLFSETRRDLIGQIDLLNLLEDED